MEVEGNLSDKALVDLKIIDRALKGGKRPMQTCLTATATQFIMFS